MKLPSWVPGEETKPAPMPLLRIQAFLNTYEPESGHDLLSALSTGRPWLVESGMLGATARLTEEDLEVARSVREGIRALLAAHSEKAQAPPAAVAGLRALARTTWIRPELSPEGRVDLALADPAESLDLGQLLVVIRDAQRDGSWVRLKACHDTDCRRAFYDRSHAKRGTWCDMAVCGNRAKNRTLRAKRAPAVPLERA